MVTMRLHRVGLATPVAAKMRLHRVGLSGDTPAKMRLHRVGLSGEVAVAIENIPARTVEPGSTVSLVASLQAGIVADSYSFTQIAGPSTPLVGTGNSRSFLAPAAPEGTQVRVAVVATRDGVSSAEVIATIDVLPQIEWYATAGGQWAPAYFTQL